MRMRRLLNLRNVVYQHQMLLTGNCVGAFVGGDLVLVLERQADVVQAVEQAMAAERLDLERQQQAVVVGERLLLQIGRERVAGLSRGPAGTARRLRPR